METEPQQEKIANEWLHLDDVLPNISLSIHKHTQNWNLSYKNIWNWMKNKSPSIVVFLFYIFSLFCHNFWFHKIVMFALVYANVKIYETLQWRQSIHSAENTGKWCVEWSADESKKKITKFNYIYIRSFWLGCVILSSLSLELRAFCNLNDKFSVVNWISIYAILRLVSNGISRLVRAFPIFRCLFCSWPFVFSRFIWICASDQFNDAMIGILRSHQYRWNAINFMVWL